MNTRLMFLAFLGLLIPLISGCGKPPMVSVSGTVKYQGRAIPHCKVGLYPDVSNFDPNTHGYGFGITDDKGAFKIQHPNGEPGIFPGRYKVTFVAWVDASGKPLPPDIKPSEVAGGVKNLLPEKYESLSSTPEILSVPSSGTTKDFELN
jgi:hypothetical protein